MASKKTKETFISRDIPSFLLELKLHPEELKISLKNNQPGNYLGPVFFGCEEKHPRPHALNIENIGHTHFTGSSTEDILKDLFLPKEKPVEKFYEQKPVVIPDVPRPKIFNDGHPHKCPGVRRVFVPEHGSPRVDLGQSVSIIEGEKVQEIPICCIKKVLSSTGEAKYEILTLSDFREKELKYKPYIERIAHAHFPKKFVTVRIIGPTIPEAITITKLPSKRKPQNAFTKRRKAEKPPAESATIEKDVEETNNNEVVIDEPDIKPIEVVFSTQHERFSDTKEDERVNESEENDVDTIQEEVSESNEETAEETGREAEKEEEEEDVEGEGGDVDLGEGGDVE